MANNYVSVELTPDGYTVTCAGTRVTGHGRTETDAWNDFLAAYRAQWKPLTQPASGGLNGHQRRRRILTLRVRSLFG
ncbi:hypothetical protein [Streptomyces chryseus]